MKLTLAVAMMLGATSLFAQKFGQIDMQALLLSMPETKGEMQAKMEEFTKNLQDTYETMNVEFNTKYQDYMKNMNTLPESTRQIKEKELNELSNRRDEFIQMAQQDSQKEQARLMEPIIAKAREALNRGFEVGRLYRHLPDRHHGLPRRRHGDRHPARSAALAGHRSHGCRSQLIPRGNRAANARPVRRCGRRALFRNAAVLFGKDSTYRTMRTVFP